MRSLLVLTAVAASCGCAESLNAATPASDAAVSRYASRLLVENYAPSGPGAAVIVARGDKILFRSARGASDEALIPPHGGVAFRGLKFAERVVAMALVELDEGGAMKPRQLQGIFTKT